MCMYTLFDLQVDLHRVIMVEALSIWSRAGVREWVSQFNVSTSLNGDEFEFIRDPLDYYNGYVPRDVVSDNE